MNVHNKYFLIFCGMLVAGFTIKADKIKVYNKTLNDVYTSVYYKYRIPSFVASRTVSPALIKANKFILISRPIYKFKHDRDLVFDVNLSSLGSFLNKNGYSHLSHKNIGSLQGDTFYIVEKKGVLKGYNKVEWEVLKPLLNNVKKSVSSLYSGATKPVRDLIKSKQSAIFNNPYQNKKATVRIGNNLSLSEINYLKKREPKVRKALSLLLGKPLDGKKVPKISVVASGGGYRAMTCALGFLSGMDSIGLLDGITYLVGLSGGTWAIGLWTAHGMPIKEFNDYIFKHMQPHIKKTTKKEGRLIWDSLFVKSAYIEPITMVDIYGLFLSNRLLSKFGDKRQNVYLSDQANLIESGDWPFPIYTAVRGEFGVRQDWYEFTPYEVGGAWLGHYVPSWGFGRKFKSGISINNAPEQGLGTLMGIFGSAFAATFEQVYKNSGKDIKEPFKSLLNGILSVIGDNRITWGEVFNFTRNMNTSSVTDKKTLKMVDAGLDFNLPYPPVSGERKDRSPEILLFLDASKTIKNAPALKGAEDYARKKGLKFPKIDYTDLEKRTVSIFKDESDPTVPMVIYMPRVKDTALWESKKEEFKAYKSKIDGFNPEKCTNEGFCKTSNFEYKQEDAHKLALQMQFNIEANKGMISEAISFKINQMNSY